LMENSFCSFNWANYWQSFSEAIFPFPHFVVATVSVASSKLFHPWIDFYFVFRALYIYACITGV
jgi:hypothetical protein